MAFGVFLRNSSLSLRSFDNFARLDAPCADLHSAVAARRELDSNRLQIRIEPTACFVVSVGNIVSKLRAFPANVTSFCHINNCLQKNNEVIKKILSKTQKESLYQNKSYTVKQ